MVTKLERKFDEAMMDIYRRAKSEAGYNASEFHAMLDRNRGLITAKRLINAKEVSIGYTNLHLLGRLDLTVEAVVYENELWHPMFEPEELERCRKRLVDVGYDFKAKS